MMQEIFSVSELTLAIKKQLESGFSHVSVKGEISNLKEQSSGHLYFTLKDVNAQISAVLFRGYAKDLNRFPKNGDQVILHGEITVYAPRGNYQIIVRKLECLGIGELLQQLYALKQKLEKQGWFETSRKKNLPQFPQIIGVVTSPTGSVIQDILNVLGRRLSGFHLRLNPVKVQGEGAADEIAKAIVEFNRYRLADVLIIGRGGGSLEDLWAFNEEKVATAIFNSQIPIISAVGHETDFSIADFVADVRAPTPSAAAEIATYETVQQLQFLIQIKKQLKNRVLTTLQHHRKQLNSIKRHPYLVFPYSLLEPHFQRVDDLGQHLTQSLKRSFQEKQLRLLALKKQAEMWKPSHQIAVSKQKLILLIRSIDTTIIQHWIRRKNLFQIGKQMGQHFLKQIDQNKQQLNQLTSHLRSIDPKNLLTKGYCILFRENNDSVIFSSSQLEEQDKVRLRLHDGQVHLTVNRIDHDTA